MKTLIIHPSDHTTDFLKPIYETLADITIIDKKISKGSMIKAIKEHDRIIMMGHGCEKGLMNSDFDAVIDSQYVEFLREKECIAIWCNADVFFLKYELKGLYTGMIISELIEANMYCIDGSYDDIQESNRLFAEAMTEGISNDDFDMETIQLIYNSDDNNIIKFNQERIYEI